MILPYLNYGFRQFFIRLKRFFTHFILLDEEFRFAYKDLNRFVLALVWLLELVLRFLEIFFVFDLVQILISIRPAVNPLNSGDLELAKSILGDKSYLRLIQLNDRSIYCKTNPVIAFVSGFVINYDRVISDDVLAHELIHVWQYYRVGIVYVPRALYAQRTEENYDYGGLKKLLNHIKEGKSILEYNYEQQAQIIQDFFLYYQTSNMDPLTATLNSSIHSIKGFLNKEGLMTSV